MAELADPELECTVIRTIEINASRLARKRLPGPLAVQQAMTFIWSFYLFSELLGRYWARSRISQRCDFQS